MGNNGKLVRENKDKEGDVCLDKVSVPSFL